MWNERYREPGYAYGTEPNAFLASVAGRIPRGRILSLAEGEGRNAVFLAAQGCDVTAVDASEVGLAKAARLAGERGVSITTVHADLAAFAIAPDAWDGVVAIFCHLPGSVRAGVHRAAAAGLRRGGVFVLEAYTPRQLEHGTGGPRDVGLLITLEALREELAGLRFIHAAEVERDVIEGRYHTGRAAVVQVLAVRD